MRLAKTNNFILCHEFLIDYIQSIKWNIELCVKKLSEQIELNPFDEEISLENIDQNLKIFVDLQRSYLLKSNYNQLNKFKVNIENNQILKDMITYYPLIDKFIQELLNIREQQTKIWEQQLLLEIRVYSKFLPQEYDQLEEMLTFDTCLPSNNNNPLERIQIQNQHFKIIQEAKRQWLNLSMSIYELELQTYEQKYQETLNELHINLQNELCFSQINEYMIRQTKELKQQIINKIPAYRRKLLRNYQRSSSKQTTIGISPEPYLDLLSNPFNKHEWHYLSLGKCFVNI